MKYKTPKGKLKCHDPSFLLFRETHLYKRISAAISTGYEYNPRQLFSLFSLALVWDKEPNTWGNN